MLTEQSIDVIERFWASDLNCRLEDLRGEKVIVTRRSGGPGVFILARLDVLTVPSGVHLDYMLGPAFIGYADAGTFVGGDDAEARALGDGDDAGIAGLHSSCGALEWEHGGPTSEDAARIGVFKGGTLAALASYRIWGDRIAHISIITHPLFRSGGRGRIAVSAITRRALDNDLVAQYHTLASNIPSLAIAKRLGFQQYAYNLVIQLDQ
jgi:GNAT superfamily N-acetyltransferase